MILCYLFLELSPLPCFRYSVLLVHIYDLRRACYMDSTKGSVATTRCLLIASCNDPNIRILVGLWVNSGCSSLLSSLSTKSMTL